MEGQASPESGRGGLVNSEELHAVERDRNGAAVIRYPEVLPGAGGQVLAGQPLLAGRGVAFQLCAGQDLGRRHRRSGDVPPGSTPQHNGSGGIQFQQQAGSGAGGAQEQPGPSHRRPEARLQPDVSDGRAGEGQVRRTGNPQGAVQDFQRSAAAGPPADPFGVPVRRIEPCAEALLRRPWPGEAHGVVHPDGPAVVGVGGEVRASVRNKVLFAGGHNARIPHAACRPPR